MRISVTDKYSASSTCTNPIHKSLRKEIVWHEVTELLLWIQPPIAARLGGTDFVVRALFEHFDNLAETALMPAQEVAMTAIWLLILNLIEESTVLPTIFYILISWKVSSPVCSAEPVREHWARYRFRRSLSPQRTTPAWAASNRRLMMMAAFIWFRHTLFQEPEKQCTNLKIEKQITHIEAHAMG